MTSEGAPGTAFVWVWLPGAGEPVVAGRLDAVGVSLQFTYGQSYLARENAISLYVPELPLGDDSIMPLVGTAPGCIEDAAPDSWGQRVILNRRLGRDAVDTADLTLLDYLLESGSDRIGALDFQDSPRTYIPRVGASATLTELAESADMVDRRVPLTPPLADALLRGSSIGGARPKVGIEDGERRLIAKFASQTDPYPVVQAEFVGMRLAALAGLDVAPVELTTAMDKHALLVERFDRPGSGERRAMVSALTILGLAEHEARYASYADLARIVRERFAKPDRTLHELFARITFNILISNNDDHARNHSAFWDGEALRLTPAYDLCPQRRDTGSTEQVMIIGEDGWKASRLQGCIERAATYHLTAERAREIVDRQIGVIEKHWAEVCTQAELSELDARRMWGTQLLNPSVFESYSGRTPSALAP